MKETQFFTYIYFKVLLVHLPFRFEHICSVSVSEVEKQNTATITFKPRKNRKDVKPDYLDLLKIKHVYYRC